MSARLGMDFGGSASVFATMQVKVAISNRVKVSMD